MYLTIFTASSLTFSISSLTALFSVTHPNSSPIATAMQAISLSFGLSDVMLDNTQFTIDPAFNFGSLSTLVFASNMLETLIRFTSPISASYKALSKAFNSVGPSAFPLTIAILILSRILKFNLAVKINFL